MVDGFIYYYMRILASRLEAPHGDGNIMFSEDDGSEAMATSIDRERSCIWIRIAHSSLDQGSCDKATADESLHRVAVPTAPQQLIVATT